MDPELLEKAILDRKEKTGKYPKAIVPVALYGMPYDCERIMAIANKYGIKPLRVFSSSLQAIVKASFPSGLASFVGSCSGGCC